MAKTSKKTETTTESADPKPDAVLAELAEESGAAEQEQGEEASDAESAPSAAPESPGAENGLEQPAAPPVFAAPLPDDSWMAEVEPRDDLGTFVVAEDARFIGENNLPCTIKAGTMVTRLSFDLAALRAAGVKLNHVDA